MKIVFAIFFSLVFCVLLLPAQDVPRVISYQGVLTDANGKPLSGGPKHIDISIVSTSGVAHPSGFKHTEDFILQGGLFHASLGKLPESNMSFPILDGNWQLKISNITDGNVFYVPLYSAVSALNIADSVVTTAKIKDGAVLSQKIAPKTVVRSINGKQDSVTILGYQGINISSTFGNIIRLGLPSGTDTNQVLKWNSSTSSWTPTIIQVPSSVPVGTIIAFGGDKSQIPSDWMLCDGTEFNSTDLPSLFLAISSNWGGRIQGTTTYFKLPDLQGYFLRGVDYGKGRDPDASNRTDYSGNISGNKVGTIQSDDFKRHYHDINEPTTHGAHPGPNQGFISSDVPTASANTGTYHTNTEYSSNTCSETRPKNAYVNYIIKVK